jgi:hypothetical protein
MSSPIPYEFDSDSDDSAFIDTVSAGVLREFRNAVSCLTRICGIIPCLTARQLAF